ncbi:MAG: recombinase family protein, partial [Oscillospiraceae bacterium]|nr:recombinase family protein [Oscillospiraceae bacterium]
MFVYLRELNQQEAVCLDGNNRVYGYARVSSKEQNLDRQLEVLKQYVDERNIITDKQSGKDFERNGYQTLKSQLLRAGDTLYIKELDRLGRDYTQMKKEYAELIDRDINVVIIDTPLLSTADKSDLEKSLISSMVFELFAYLAEKERLKIRSRCAEGIESAKKRG